MEWKTLEEYLREQIREEKIDFYVRAQIRPTGRVTFYIHPAYQDGETVNFLADGNFLAHDPNVTRG